MDLFTVVLVLIAVGVALYFLNVKPLPIYAPYIRIINAVVLIAVGVWLLSLFGIFDLLKTIKFPKL